MSKNQTKRNERVSNAVAKTVATFIDHACNAPFKVRFTFIWRILTKDRALRKRLRKGAVS